MDLSALIAQYGLVAVLAGCLLEGETVLLLAGYAVHRGYLDLAAVIAVAIAGAAIGDQLWFLLGRRQGTRLIVRRPWLNEPVQRALLLIERHPTLIILAMRFIWGLRTALPIAVGMSHIPWWRFLLLNLLSALLWAPLVTGAGYVFGALLARHIDGLHRVEHWGHAGGRDAGAHHPSCRTATPQENTMKRLLSLARLWRPLLIRGR